MADQSSVNASFVNDGAVFMNYKDMDITARYDVEARKDSPTKVCR